MSLKIYASSQHYYNSHQTVSFFTDRSALVPSSLSFPPGSQVSGKLLPGGLESEHGGKEG